MDHQFFVVSVRNFRCSFAPHWGLFSCSFPLLFFINTRGQEEVVPRYDTEYHLVQREVFLCTSCICSRANEERQFFYVSIEFLIVFCVGPANCTKQEKDSRIHKSNPKTKREALTSTTDYYVVAQWLFNLLRPNSVFLRGQFNNPHCQMCNVKFATRN